MKFSHKFILLYSICACANKVSKSKYISGTEAVKRTLCRGCRLERRTNRPGTGRHRKRLRLCLHNKCFRETFNRDTLLSPQKERTGRFASSHSDKLINRYMPARASEKENQLSSSFIGPLTRDIVNVTQCDTHFLISKKIRTAGSPESLI